MAKLAGPSRVPFADLGNVDELVMAEECPRCAAAPGRRCHKGYGHRAAAPHNDRRKKAAARYERERDGEPAGGVNE